MPDFSTQNNF